MKKCDGKRCEKRGEERGEKRGEIFGDKKTIHFTMKLPNKFYHQFCHHVFSPHVLRLTSPCFCTACCAAQIMMQKNIWKETNFHFFTKFVALVALLCEHCSRLNMRNMRILKNIDEAVYKAPPLRSHRHSWHELNKQWGLMLKYSAGTKHGTKTVAI